MATLQDRVSFRQLKKWKFRLFNLFILTILAYFYCFHEDLHQPNWSTDIYYSLGSTDPPPDQKDWQDVTSIFLRDLNTSELVVNYSTKFRVYSAFAFENSKFDGQLIVIGSHMYPMIPLQCRFHSHPNNPLITEATADFIPKWHARFSAVFIKCPFPSQLNISSGSHLKPLFVSIAPHSTIPSNRLRINYQPYQGSASSNFRFNFSVCVLPTFNGYNKVFNFLQWFEYYKIMGVQHFTFYNMSVSPSISCIWNHMFTSGQVTVHPWHDVPIVPNSHKFEYSIGYSAAIADCQFRYTGISKYVVVVDFDEFISPVLSNLTSFQDLISYLDSTRPEVEFGEYVFLNGYFLVEKQPDPLVGKRCAPLRHQKGQVSSSPSLEYQVCQQLFMMKYIQREAISNLRNKYIMMPERVQVAGNHYVHIMEHPANYSTYNVTETIAYQRHFRATLSLAHNSSERRLDIQVGLRLASGVAKLVELYKNTCGLRNEDIFI